MSNTRIPSMTHLLDNTHKRRAIRNLYKMISEGGGGGGSYPPSGGVPKSDLSSSVQASLDKADSAIQPMAIVSASGTTLTAQDNTLYNFSGEVNTLAITLPAITDTTHTHEIEFIFNTGYSPAITFTDAGGGNVIVQGDLVINNIAAYELNALWAGQWIVAGIKLYQSGK